VIDWNLNTDPRPWQRAALASWHASGMTGIARVVTGAGKTMFAEMCVLDFFSRVPDGRIVVVVPTLALLDQWFVDLREDIGVESGDITVFSGEQHADRFGRINLMVINTARREAERAASSRTMLIVDECHRAGAPTNAQALRGQHRATLGISATPEREYDEAFSQVLVPALGPLIFEYSYDEARRDGVITDFDLFNVAVDLTPDEQAAYDRLSQRVASALRRRKEGEESDERLRILLRQRAAVSASAASRVPVAAAIAHEHRGQRTVIFHEKIAAANEIYSLLHERDHNVTLYHSRIAPALRRDNLRLFRLGVFQTLVSCRALDEGMNVPETEIGIIASSTASHRQRIQRLGRVLRPTRGKEGATIYTLYATEVEERRLRDEEANLSAARRIGWQRAGLPRV
jgi:superfamily II DNA or RNA helicase